MSLCVTLSIMESAPFFIPSPHPPTPHVWISLLQLQLLHGGPRVWEGAPYSCRVRVAQDVAPKPPPAVQRRSRCQRESRRFVSQQQQQQQLHQHQEGNAVRPNHRDVQSQQKICVLFSVSFPVVSLKFPTALPAPGLFSVIRFLFFFFLEFFPSHC